jgi:hypothetical protein
MVLVSLWDFRLIVVILMTIWIGGMIISYNLNLNWYEINKENDSDELLFGGREVILGK